jgi:sec-independent protein translocase protein TatB
MFGLDWTKLLVVGVVALIVIGPKDLPVVMGRLGKMVAMIRRLGGEFQREINKTTGLDQITDLRRSITEPIKSVADSITRDFNRTTPSGTVEPSGIIAPKSAGSESVVAEIHEKIGMATPPAEPTHVESPAPVEAIAPAAVAVAPAKRAPRKSRARKDPAAAGPVVEVSRARKELAAEESAKSGKPAAKPRTRKPKADS